MMRVHIRLGDALGDKEPHQRRLRPSMAAYTTQAIVQDTIVHHFIEAVVSVATSSCASARKDGENEPNQINGCVPMKKKVSVEHSKRQYHTRVRTTAEAYG